MEAIDIFSYFLLLGLLLSAARVVTTSNVIHAAVALVFTLTITAVIFLLLSAEFVGLVIVMVYIGAVIVLFLFGMITRAPLGEIAELDNDKNKTVALVISFSIFGLFSYILLDSFDGQINITEGTSTEILGQILLSRFVFPFEIVSFVLLAALIGGITLARKDNSLVDEDQV